MRFSIAAALTFSVSNLAYAQDAPRFYEIAVLTPAQSAGLVVEFKMSAAGANENFTVELDQCLNDLARFAKETKARDGFVFSPPDYGAIGDQSSVMNKKNILLGLRCELTPKAPLASSPAR